MLLEYHIDILLYSIFLLLKNPIKDPYEEETFFTKVINFFTNDDIKELELSLTDDIYDYESSTREIKNIITSKLITKKLIITSDMFNDMVRGLFYPDLPCGLFYLNNNNIEPTLKNCGYKMIEINNFNS